MVEHVHQHEDDEVHRGVVVIVKQHLVERGLLELPLGVGFYRFVVLWGVYRHNAERFYHMGSGGRIGSGEWGEGDKERGRQVDEAIRRREDKRMRNFLLLVPLSPGHPVSPSPLTATNWQGLRLSVSITAFDTVELFE